MQVTKNTIYQHYKGDMYLVLGVATNEGNFEPTVFYESLNTHLIWSRPLSDFLADVETGNSKNVTGQSKRFIEIKDFKNTIANLSTGALVDELKKREDNPFRSIMLQGADEVFTDEYCVGYLDAIKKADGTQDERFNTVNVYDNLERALRFKEELGLSSVLGRKPLILRRFTTFVK